MKQESKRKIIVGGLAITLIIVILSILLLRNLKSSKDVNSGNFLSTMANSDSKLIASYIKEGITIGGVTGTLKVTNTEDANAKSEDIDYGVTAYINGEKVEGRKLSLNAIGISFEEDIVLYDIYKNQFVVPAGFKIISDPSITTKDGIIIEDSNENQFVWVRVDDPESLFGEDENGISLNGISVTTNVYSKLTPRSAQSSTKVVLPGDTSGIREPDITYNVGAEDYYNYDTNLSYYNGILGFDSYEEMAQSFVDEYKQMSDSIKKYDGFYIGRYELTGSIDEPTEKTGKALVNKWYYMYKACKNLIKDHETVKSTMIWGIQWDATCTFLKNSGWDTDTYSSLWGKYGEDSTLEIKTGSDSRYEANGIFDFAGNNYEWTQEISENGARVMRGGCCRVNGAVEPAANRRTQRVAYSTRAYGGSRVTLYIK